MKHSKYLLLLLLFIFLGCEDNNIEPNNYDGEIYGIVYDFETELPLDNCILTLHPTVASARTSALGEFIIKNVDVDDYNIIIEKSGYRIYQGNVVVNYDKTTYLNIALKKDSPNR